MKRPYTAVILGTSLAVVGVLVIAAVRPDLLRTAHTMAVEDFGAYWIGTKVELAGGNAYDDDQLLPLEQEIEPDRTVVVAAWSPPWTFAALAPLASLDFPTARWIWRFLQIGTLFFALTALWSAYGGPPGRLIWVWCAALVWYPTLQTLGLGQHSNLVLLGVAGFLACISSGRSFAAGACLALTLVKPQNAYLVGLLAVIWSIDRRDWRLVAGAVVGTAAFTGLTLAVNPAVFRDYWIAFTTHQPITVPPTFGMVLRMALGGGHFWLLFIPSMAGIAWAVWYYLRHRRDWDWLQHMPVVILVSCVTSPYGWMYDQVLFLIPLVAILAKVAGRPNGIRHVVMCVAGLTALCLALHGAGMREVWFVWHAPFCLILHLVVSRLITCGAPSARRGCRTPDAETPDALSLPPGRTRADDAGSAGRPAERLVHRH